MWMLVINGIVYRHTRHCHRPLPPQAFSDLSAEVVADVLAALRGSSRMTISRSTTRCSGCFIRLILAGVVIVLSGLSIWKPVQLQELTALFGGYDAARYVHFVAMSAIVAFRVHVLLALLVPKSLRAMIIGR